MNHYLRSYPFHASLGNISFKARKPEVSDLHETSDAKEIMGFEIRTWLHADGENITYA